MKQRVQKIPMPGHQRPLISSGISVRSRGNKDQSLAIRALVSFTFQRNLHGNRGYSDANSKDYRPHECNLNPSISNNTIRA